jgi:hypothetical protein
MNLTKYIQPYSDPIGFQKQYAKTIQPAMKKEKYAPLSERLSKQIIPKEPKEPSIMQELQKCTF